jgi:hypothetical protein
VVDEAGSRSGERLDRQLALVEPATLTVRSRLLAGVAGGAIEDLAFIGNASAVYPWISSLMVDLDVFLFAGRLDVALGHWLLGVRDGLTAELAGRGADFELRIVEGPYKPAIRQLARPVIVAHLGVFTEAMYVAEAPLKRWAWRKYPCERETDRLMRLAPAPPDLNEILNGNRGVRHRLHALRSGRIEMREWLLPDFAEVPLHIGRGQPNFIECCFAYAANCARHHCRALDNREADRLGNEEFFPWYAANVFASPALSELMALKARCRNTGFDVDATRVQALAIEYISDLEAIIEARVTGRSAPS